MPDHRPPQPIRVAVRATAPTTKAEVTRRARTAAGAAGVTGPVRARRMLPDGRRDWIVEFGTAEAIGSPAYTGTAWGLTHLLQDDGAFELAEADVPVGAFAPGSGAAGAFDETDCAADPASAGRSWALDTIRCGDALALMDPAVRGGVGIRIGHPDSGFSGHFALAADVDRNADWDQIDDDDDATDPLRPPHRSFFNPLPNPGHGTSTASVILGHGDGAGFSGVAPQAVLVPFRSTESVVQLFDSDVADAVRRARSAGCQVISMSLGGTGFFGLQEAIEEAVADGVIVMAAAGNQVRVVTAPASYDSCLAVAATGTGDSRWNGSSRGGAVDVSAPGACVWAALYDWTASPPSPIVGRSSGTSYAVAHLAGCAALWLAHHGYAALSDRYGRGRIQAVFLHQLRSPGVCVRPAGWDDDWGVGRVDAARLLSHPLPDPAAVDGVGAFGFARTEGPVERIGSMTGVAHERVRSWLRDVLGDDPARWQRFEGELVHLLLADPSFLGELVMPGLGAFPVAPSGASPQLRASLTGRR